MRFSSEVIEVPDYHAAVELFFARGWTDGLAVVPPTEEAVAAMVRAAGREPHEEIGEIPPAQGIATIEKLAINSVMAGCRPEYFPIIIAAVEAMLEPEHNLNGVQTTTHCCVPLVIVNGPIAKALRFNASDGVFGSGFRANGTVGRAIRLILWNLGGNIPGEVDKSAQAHPGKWSFCIAEHEDATPWQPLHVERGIAAGNNAVTVFSCEAPHSVLCYGTAKQMLATLVSSLATLGSNNVHAMGETLVVLNPWQARQFHQEGWSKADIKMHLWQHARTPVGQIKAVDALGVAGQFWPKWVDVEDEQFLVPLTARPEDIHLVVAGGETYFAAICPGWGGLGGFAVTKEVRSP
ncbi:MAG: hypothetical protein AB1671_21065 [Thermodesulfobacteriota bacterium]|jgi:hypothetical protein